MSSLTYEEKKRIIRHRFAHLQLKEPNAKGLTKAVELEWEKMKDLWGKYRAQKEVIQMLTEEVLHRPISSSDRPLSPSALPERDPKDKDNERYIDKKLPLALERLGLS